MGESLSDKLWHNSPGALEVRGPEVVETFYNEKEQAIRVPFSQSGVLSEEHHLHLCQEQGGRAWRVIAVNPLATRMRLVLRNDLDESTVTISRLSLRGPIWWPRSTE